MNKKTIDVAKNVLGWEQAKGPSADNRLGIRRWGAQRAGVIVELPVPTWVTKLAEELAPQESEAESKVDKFAQKYGINGTVAHMGTELFTDIMRQSDHMKKLRDKGIQKISIEGGFCFEFYGGDRDGEQDIQDLEVITPSTLSKWGVTASLGKNNQVKVISRALGILGILKKVDEEGVGYVPPLSPSDLSREADAKQKMELRDYEKRFLESDAGYLGSSLKSKYFILHDPIYKWTIEKSRHAQLPSPLVISSNNLLGASFRHLKSIPGDWICVAQVCSSISGRHRQLPSQTPRLSVKNFFNMLCGARKNALSLRDVTEWVFAYYPQGVVIDLPYPHSTSLVLKKFAPTV